MSDALSINPASSGGFSGALLRPASSRVPSSVGESAAVSSFEASLREVEARKELEPARDAARQIVATALVQPVLAMLRESNTAEGPFAPGDAERRFGPLLEQQIADRITQSANFPLVEQIARQLQAGSARNGAGNERSGEGTERNGAGNDAPAAAIHEGRRI